VNRRADRLEPAMPDWPTLMGIEMACAYLGGMSEATFKAIAAKTPPVDFSGIRLRRWRRADLDLLVAELPAVDREGRGARQSRAESPPPIDLAAVALERAGRKRRG